jgi:hypothetical protein
MRVISRKDLELEKRSGRERLDRLIHIAENNLGPDGYQQGITRHPDEFFVFCVARESLPIGVYGRKNMIRIQKESALPYAVKLAQAYEDAGEPEFRVLKDYSERAKPMDRVTGC